MVRLAREEANSLAALHAAVLGDTTQTIHARALRVADAAVVSGQRVVKQLDEARAKVLAVIERDEKLSASPPPPITAFDIAREGQLRSRLASMGDKERDDVISDAFAKNKTNIVAAILHGEAFEIGIGEAKLDSLRYKYREAFHPDTYRRTKRLRDALGAYERAGDAFTRVVNEAANSEAARHATVNAQRAEEALAAHGAR